MILWILAAAGMITTAACMPKTNQTEFDLLYGNALTIKHGQTEAEVIELLGKPNETLKGESEGSKVLSFYSGAPIDNHITVSIKDGKVVGGMAVKNKELSIFGKNASGSEPAKGGRPQAPPPAGSP